MKTVLALALAAIVTSCAPVSNTVTPTAETINKKWELISLEGREITTSKPVFIDFDANNKITGFAGCNTLNGNYMVKNGTQINFTQVASTRMMCAPYDMNVEKEVMDVLKTADNFTLNNGQLMLNVGRRAPLAVFAEMSKDPALNTYWSLKELNGKKVTMVPNQEKEQGFMLRSGGKITGFAGCNSFSGNYTLSGKNTITFNPNMAMTKMACPDVKLNEQTFANIFKNANNYQVKDKMLILKDAGNKVFAVFETN
ncbi:META domain-containing protein [Kaistella antarctica]|uniref:Heat-inducible protein n=1 Tax=Kaistella antarctica TaxID=266748 RepID=A0A448NQ28_9FLAO|nr:META domain-containing protein [Kaistella antarctica]SEW04649.1 Heat shock protein HslJ [Kaistella antarctica]VEH98610.1 heat-inducible protein [Kaistella antarctica]